MVAAAIAQRIAYGVWCIVHINIEKPVQRGVNMIGCDVIELCMNVKA